MIWPFISMHLGELYLAILEQRSLAGGEAASLQEVNLVTGKHKVVELDASNSSGVVEPTARRPPPMPLSV
jgi:hypothetical protein